MSRCTVWIVGTPGDYPGEMGEASLVIARDEREAVRLHAAVTGDSVDNYFADRAEWRLGGEGPMPVDVLLGVWAPKEAVMAGYGFVPTEDWRECPCCGLILPDDAWSEERDDADECDECGA